MSAIQQTCVRLREMRLGTMAEAYERQLEQPKLHQIGFDERFGMLVESEASGRQTRKLKRLIASAGFPEQASLEDVDLRPGRGLDKNVIASLATCEWIKRHQNVILAGATGVGKSWLACALGQQACRQGLSTAFYRVIDLCDAVHEGMADGSLPTLKTRLMNVDLLILDDLGIGKVSQDLAQTLLQVEDRRMRTGSLIITSQFPVEKWHGLFPDATVADAILDRVVHVAHPIHLKGESMRKVRARADPEKRSA